LLLLLRAVHAARARVGRSRSLCVRRRVAEAQDGERSEDTEREHEARAQTTAAATATFLVNFSAMCHPVISCD
jgi:hypothetical protein